MKRIPCLAVLAISLSVLVQAKDAAKPDSGSCGPGYPADFPCIAGGRLMPGVEGLPNLQTMNVINYDTTPKKIAERIEAEATRAGWVVTDREVGREHDAPRYRFSFTRAGVKVHASAFQSSGLTVLMVVTMTEVK